MAQSTSTSQPSTPWGRTLIWGFLALLLAALALGLSRAQRGPVNKGEQAPDFTLTTFDGERIALAGLRGKVVLLNFWASWCKPCEQEAPFLQAAWEYYQPRGDVVFIGAAYVDTESDSLAYIEKFGITYLNGPDVGTRMAQAYRIKGVPETFIIDQNGVVAHVEIGPFPSLDEITSVIDALLEP